MKKRLTLKQQGLTVSLGTRVTAETKAKLIAAAKESGRSMTAEAAYILERSFEQDAEHWKDRLTGRWSGKAVYRGPDGRVTAVETHTGEF